MSVTPFPIERARPSADAGGPGARFTAADRSVLAPVHHLVANAESVTDLVAVIAARAGVAHLMQEGGSALSLAGKALGLRACTALRRYDEALKAALQTPGDEQALYAAADELADVCEALARLRYGAA